MFVSTHFRHKYIIEYIFFCHEILKSVNVLDIVCSMDFYSIFVQVGAYYGNMQHYINGYVKYSIT